MYQSLEVFSSSEKRSEARHHSTTAKSSSKSFIRSGSAREAGEHAPVYEIEDEYYVVERQQQPASYTTTTATRSYRPSA